MSNITLNARTKTIAEAIYATCAGIGFAVDEVNDAKDALDTKREAGTSLREDVMVKIAELSLAGSWTESEIKDATQEAAKKCSNQTTDKAISTFIGECKRAAHPSVRDHVPALLDIRNTAWDAESELSKELPTPIRKAFKRKYHAFVGAMIAVQDGVVISTVEDLVKYSVKRDPDHNVDGVYKRLMKIKADLAAFHVDFPVEDVGSVVDILGKVSKSELSAARATKLEAERLLTPTVVTTTPAQSISTSQSNDPAPEVGLTENVTSTTVEDNFGPTQNNGVGFRSGEHVRSGSTVSDVDLDKLLDSNLELNLAA